jgi:hypothetical protein
MWRVLIALITLAACGGATLAADCETIAARMERRFGVPEGLLRAIALTESGRHDRTTGRFGPWPWAIASGPDFSHFAEDKAAALAKVRELQAEGRRNIDVGCMQVNLLHHPNAFPSLEAAFDPERNVEYGARFLSALRAETGSWAKAVARYHSADPVRGEDYRGRVFARWTDAPSRIATAQADERRPGLRVLRPRVAEEPSTVAEAKDGTPFAWATPRWRLTPVRVGPSLWTHRPARPLDLSRHIKRLPKRVGGVTEQLAVDG